MQKFYAKQIIQLEKEIIELAGEEFNISSPKQMGPILFEKLKIDTNARKTKTKQYSTAEEVLVRIADRHPIVNKILEFRGLKKLLSTYVEALPLLVNSENRQVAYFLQSGNSSNRSFKFSESKSAKYSNPR